ncbi:MAG: hypothetical protein Q9209_003117 [Squamulea sp. 1 TL-2023]
MAFRMMDFWRQLCAQALEPIISYFQEPKQTSTEHITKVVKTITTEKFILGHSITKISKFIPTEALLQPSGTLIAAASKTALAGQDSSTSFEVAGFIASFDWSFLGLLLCTVCMLAVIGLCLGYSHYNGTLCPARLPFGHLPFVDLFCGFEDGSPDIDVLYDVIKERDDLVQRKEQRIAVLIEDRDSFKNLYSRECSSKFLVERRFNDRLAEILKATQVDKDFRDNRNKSVSNSNRTLRETQRIQQRKYDEYVRETSRQITMLEQKAENSNSQPCVEHSQRITELNGENSALREQLKMKDGNVQTQPKPPAMESANVDITQLEPAVLQTVYQHFWNSEWSQTQGDNTRMRDEGQKLKASYDALKETFDKLNHDRATDQKVIAQLEERIKNSREAHSAALEKSHNLTLEVEQLRKSTQAGNNIDTSKPQSQAQPYDGQDLAAKAAYYTAFPNPPKSISCRGAQFGLRCLVESLKLQYGINHLTIDTLQSICEDAEYSTQIKEARLDPPNKFEHDPGQLAYILGVWSEQQFEGVPMLLGARSRPFGTKDFSYQVLGHQNGKRVLWVERSVPMTNMQQPQWFGLGPKNPPATRSDGDASASGGMAT